MTNNSIEIGRRIRDARKSAGLTLEELSARTKKIFSPSRISNYEQGIRVPGPEEALDLAKAFRAAGYQVTAAYLLCLDEAHHTSPGVTLSPEELALINNYRASDENWRKVIRRAAGTQPAGSVAGRARRAR